MVPNVRVSSSVLVDRDDGVAALVRIDPQHDDDLRLLRSRARTGRWTYPSPGRCHAPLKPRRPVRSTRPRSRPATPSPRPVPASSRPWPRSSKFWLSVIAQLSPAGVADVCFAAAGRPGVRTRSARSRPAPRRELIYPHPVGPDRVLVILLRPSQELRRPVTLKVHMHTVGGGGLRMDLREPHQRRVLGRHATGIVVLTGLIKMSVRFGEIRRGDPAIRYRGQPAGSPCMFR